MSKVLLGSQAGIEGIDDVHRNVSALPAGASAPASVLPVSLPASSARRPSWLQPTSAYSLVAKAAVLAVKNRMKEADDGLLSANKCLTARPPVWNPVSLGGPAMRAKGK